MRDHPTILVITHDQSPRRNSILGHLTELGLDHEISPAVFPQGELPWDACYDNAERLGRLGYPMTRGEVGCFLAHRRAWNTIVRRGLPMALVIEDDARLAEGVAEGLSAVSRALGDQAAFARLVSDPRPAYRPWADLGRHGCLAYPVRPGDLTVAYLVTQEGARALLEGSRKFWCPVDDFMNLEDAHGAVAFHVEPPMAEHHDGGASLIGRRTKPKMAAGAKVIREIRRAWHKSRLALSRELTLWRLGIRFRKARQPGS